MGATTSAKPGDVVRRFYALLGEGKVDETLELVDDAVVVHESAALPYGGEHRGKSGMRELFKRMDDCAKLENVGGIEYFDTVGDEVVVRMGFRATNRTSGRSTETEIVEVYTVRGGKVVDIDVYYRDPSAVAVVAGE